MKKILLIVIGLISFFQLYAQMDNEFWFAAPTITTDCVSGGCTGGEPIYLRIGTIDWDAKVLVTIPITGDTIAYIDVLGGGGATIDLTPWRANIETGVGKDSTGILVQSWNETTNSVSGILITAFYEINMDSKDADNFVLKGENALGTSFMVPTQNTHDNMTTLTPLPVHGVYIVATEPSAITITLPPTAAANGFLAGTVLPVINLQAGETYGLIATNHLGANHLAGTTIESTGKIAVTMSDDAVDYSPLVNKTDLNGDQIIPISLAGSDYIVMSGPGVNGSEVFITVINDGTTISIDGVPVAGNPFAAKSVYSYLLATNANSYIHTSASVLVYQLTSFQDFGGAILPPINGCTGSQDVSIFRPTTQRFHMYIMVPTGATDAFLVNGVLQDGSVNPGVVFFGPADFTVVGNGWSVIKDATWSHAAIDDGVVSKIINTEDVFHLGVVSTIAANGTSYGYFSDFGVSNASAMEVSDASGFASVCFGDSIQLTASGGSTYKWWHDETGNPDYLSDPNAQSPVLTNIPVRTNAYKYKVEILGSCTNDILEVWVEVKENIDAVFQIDDPVGCAPHTINITDLTVNGDDYRWDFEGDGFDIIDSVEVTEHTYYNSTSSDTIYNFKVRVEHSVTECKDWYERSIHVMPEITADFTPDIDIDCNPFDVQFTDNSTGNINQIYWEFGDGDVAIDTINPIHTYSNYLSKDTVYTAVLINTSPYNCEASDTHNITVRPYIEAGFSVNKNVGCAPLDVKITNLSKGDTASYFWDFYGDGTLVSNTLSTDTTISYPNTGVVPIDYTLRLVVKNAAGCPDTLERIIRVYPEIKANYTLNSYTGCNTLDAVFANTSTGHSIAEWDFGDGITFNSMASPINHTYNNYFTHDSTYEFSLHVESGFGCSDDTINYITVYRTKARFNIDTAEGCSPLNVNITNTSFGSDLIIPNLSYVWIFGDGTANDFTDNPVSHTYNNNSGTPDYWNLELKLQGNGGCRDSLSYPIIVYSEVTADFIPKNNIERCDSLVVNFTNKSSAWATFYDWKFGDKTNSSQISPTHVYRNFGSIDSVYNTHLTVYTDNGCTDTISTNVRVHPYVKADFAIDPTSWCSPFIINVEAVPYIGIGTYNWDFDNGFTTSGINPGAQTYNNSSGLTEPYSIELSVIDVTGNCHDTLIIPINVYSEVTADFIPMDTIDCNQHIVSFTNKSSSNVSTYNWDFGDGSSSSLADPPHTFVNLSNTDTVYDVKLEVTSSDGCTDDTSTTISVYSYVNAAFDINKASDCSPLIVTITNKSKGVNYRWYWDDNLSGGEDSITYFDNDTLWHTYYNNSGVTDTMLLTLIADNGNGCYDTLQKVITVYSSINAAFTVIPTEGCHPFDVQFTDETVGGSISTWDFGDGTSSSSSDTTHRYENYDTVDVTYTAVKLVSESADGCIDSISKSITVYSYLDASYTMDDNTGCPPFTTTLVNTSIGNAVNTYQWYVDGVLDGLAPVDKSDFTRVYQNITTSVLPYSVRLLATNSHNCTSQHTDTVNVYEYVQALFGMTPSPTTGCNKFNVNFQNTSTAPLVTTNYLWDFKDGATYSTTSKTAFDHEFENTDPASQKQFDVELTATTSNNCIRDTSFRVTVHPYIKADFNISVSEDCSPINLTIENKSVGGTKFYWYWDKDDYVLNLPAADSNITDASFTKQFINTNGGIRVDSITLIVGNGEGCYSWKKKAIHIKSSIDAQFSYVQPNRCNESNVTFKNETSYANNYYNWSFGDGSSFATTSKNDFTHKFTNIKTNDTTFTVTMNAESAEGCTDVYTDTVTVYSKLIAGISIPNSQGCPHFTDTIINTSIGNDANTYNWYVDGVLEHNSIGLDDFIHTYDNTDPDKKYYTVRMEASNSHVCKDDTIATITVFEYVDAQFAMDDNDGCSPHTVIFENQSTAPATNTNYYWTFGDITSSSEFGPKHLFINPSRIIDTTFRVHLTATTENYCTDTISHLVKVYHQPLAKFFIDTTSSCPPLKTRLSNESSGETMFEWRFGDGTFDTSDPSPTHSYPNTIIDYVQNYTLELWVGTDKNCKDSTSLILNVFPAVIADFDIENNAGCNPVLTYLNNESSTPAQYFYWDFDDGGTSNQESPLHEFVNITTTDTVYDVYLKASSEYNCLDDTIKQVTVYAQPIAEFDVKPIVQKYPKNRVKLDNKSNDASPWDFNHTWLFGDGQNSSSPEPYYHDYDHWGEKDITLQVNSQTSDCADTITKTIIILPPDVNAAFEVSDSIGCLNDGFEVQFTAHASAYAEDYSYSWDFNDGKFSTEVNPTHVFEEAGTYYVKMTASSNEGGGEDYEYKTIRVYSNPKALFEVMPKLVMLDAVSLEARVEFYNLSECNDTAGCAYLWSFGDDETSISRDVTHNYSPDPDDTPAKYDITLLVTTANGCKDSLTLYEEVKIIGAGEIAFPNAFNPNSSIGDNTTFKPVSEGVIKYELLVYNRWGELIFKTNDLSVGWDGTVNGKPAKPDVYVWKALGKFTNGRAFEIAGDVTLIR